jgi:hypothetical protein
MAIGLPTARFHCHAWQRGGLKVMSAIERCRTAALGGHVERCEKCSHTIIAYNSCRNRHCPKCQGARRSRCGAQQGKPRVRTFAIDRLSPRWCGVS